ncbi:uncharacterized protein LOC126315408 [Schistocerca gregaria]|uniref:uncharacterized protein LOC126315408 n=1 Tax=Schistocerca gregaria TaxID=7010 RepID=UPI00211F10A6|nr:uncharacterized protein LOC126315408 [Schistocerca gregaria]
MAFEECSLTSDDIVTLVLTDGGSDSFSKRELVPREIQRWTARLLRPALELTVRVLQDEEKVQGQRLRPEPAPGKPKSASGPNTSKRGRKQAKGLIEIEPVVGARDFYPEDMVVREWLFEQFRSVASSFCFQPYDAPILEPADLYSRKAGEDITKQMYTFKDKEDYNVTLRPEMTPSLARMLLKRGKAILFPIRWYTIAQCWRFETMTLGRKREHYQWNMDIFGVKAVTAEVELLAAITCLLSRLGLSSKDVGIKINSRRVLQQVLEPLGVVGDKFAPVCVIVDKLDKLTPEQVHADLCALGIGPEVIQKIKEILDINNLEQLESVLGSENETVQELKKIWSLAKDYGFEDWLVFDATIVRGLAYYTGIVFEVFDRENSFRAICGGGRYDNLMTTYGSKEDISAAGFGFGDVVIQELLKKKGLIPDLSKSVQDVVVPFDESLRGAACQVASKLRAKGRKVQLQLIPKKKITWYYEMASRVNAEYIYLIAPAEWKQGCVRVKCLSLPEDHPDKQKDVQFADL